MPVPPPCPYSADTPVAVRTVSALPASIRAALGEMADPGRPFQASDALPAGPHPPFKRLVSAEGAGCALTVSYEQGGIAHQWRSARFIFENGGWRRRDR